MWNVVTVNTERTMVTAVNYAPLIGATRTYAETRCRFAFGMAALSAGTPMFLMGEEIGAAKYFRTTDFNLNKEDLIGERTGDEGHCLCTVERPTPAAIARSAVTFSVTDRSVNRLQAGTPPPALYERRKNGNADFRRNLR